MLLPLKSISSPFARRGFKWQCYEKLHVDQFWVLKGLDRSNKIEMLHKIEGKSLISLRSPSPSPTVLPCCFIQDILPDPPSPFIFHIDWNTWIADMHVVCTFYSCICFFCISMCLFCWVISSCTCNSTFRVKKKYFLDVEAVKILGTDCRRHEVHSGGYGRCGQPEE